MRPSSFCSSLGGGHVLQHRQRARGGAVLVALEHGRQQHVDERAVAPHELVLDAVAAAVAEERRQHDVARVRLRRRREEVRRRAADHLVALVAHQREPAVADVEDAAVRPDRMQDRRRGLVQAAHAQLALGQLAGGREQLAALRQHRADDGGQARAASRAGARRAGAARGRSRRRCRCARRPAA